MPYREPGRVATEEELASARAEQEPARCACRAVCLCHVASLFRQMYIRDTIAATAESLRGIKDPIRATSDYERLRGRR